MTVRNILMNPDSVAPQGAPSQVVVRSTVPQRRGAESHREKLLLPIPGTRRRLPPLRLWV